PENPPELFRRHSFRRRNRTDWRKARPRVVFYSSGVSPPELVMPPAALAVWATLWAALPIPDFELLDPNGAPVRLSVHAANQPVVLVFLGAECPLANLYAPRLADLAKKTEGVRFLAVDPVPQDGSAALAHFTREHRLPFPIVKDPDA